MMHHVHKKKLLLHIAGFNQPMPRQIMNGGNNRNMNGNNRQFNGNNGNNRRQNQNQNQNQAQNQGFRAANNVQNGGGQLRRKPVKRVGGAVNKPVAGGNRPNGNAKQANAPKGGPLKKRGRVLKNGRRVHDRYQMNKPWVTDDIRTAHEKKVELANQLKGNKNDELFAEFKVKRDEFVKLYDAARQEFNKNKVNVIRWTDEPITNQNIFSLINFFVCEMNEKKK